MSQIAHQLLVALMDSIPDRIFFKDREGRFFFVNQALLKTHRLPNEEAMLGLTDFDIFAHEHAQNAFEDEQQILTTGMPMVAKLERETLPNGSTTWVSTTKVPLRDAEGEIIGICGISRTVSEHQKTEDALRQVVEDLQESREELRVAHLKLIHAEKMEAVGRMAAGIAHEVRNPLQILQISLDYLSECHFDRNAALDKALTEMRNATNRADTIIRGLLDFSHSDTLNLETQDINQLVQNALSLVRHAAASNLVTLQAELGNQLPPLALDGMKIEQVLVNLLTNAIDAMPQGGMLTVKSRMEELAKHQHDHGSREAGCCHAGDPVVVVEVEDTGKGIPSETLRKIFDPFFTTKETGKGTGLGLAITKGIIDLHGGKIEINNRPEGGVQARLLFKIPGNKILLY